jgi:hypothetical protein
MFHFTNWILAAAIIVFLFTPVLFALITLKGMREKWRYPVLRRRERDGHTSTVTSEDPPYTQAHLGESSPPVQISRQRFHSRS